MNINEIVIKGAREHNLKNVNLVIPRTKHRPACYDAQGDAHMLVSPGALDMSGLMIIPRAEDFNRLTADLTERIIKECGV